MPGDSVQAAVSLTAFHGPLAVASPRPANVRSRATNQPQRMAIDGRTELGRRVRDLAESFAQQLGGWPALSDMQVAAVRRAAELGALAEQSRRDALRGGHVDPLALSRLEGVAARAQRALCIENRRRPMGPMSQTAAAPRYRRMRLTARTLTHDRGSVRAHHAATPRDAQRQGRGRAVLSTRAAGARTPRRGFYPPPRRRIYQAGVYQLCGMSKTPACE